MAIYREIYFPQDGPNSRNSLNEITASQREQRTNREQVSVRLLPEGDILA